MRSVFSLCSVLFSALARSDSFFLFSLCFFFGVILWLSRMITHHPYSPYAENMESHCVNGFYVLHEATANCMLTFNRRLRRSAHFLNVMERLASAEE